MLLPPVQKLVATLIRLSFRFPSHGKRKIERIAASNERKKSSGQDLLLGRHVRFVCEYAEGIENAVNGHSQPGSWFCNTASRT